MEETNNNNILNTYTSNNEEIFSKSELTRDSVIGKRAVPKPPKDFFEKVLDLELKLKRRFEIKVVQQLVKYYTTAIEYYESINDPNYKQFQNNLNLLFTHPEILKMTQKNKEMLVNPLLNNESYNNRVKREQEKKEIIRKIEYKSKLNKMTNNNAMEMENVTEMIKNSENRKLDEVINYDINKQQDDFKKKLEEKRRKSALSEKGDNSSLNKSINIKKRSSNFDLPSINFGNNADNKSSNEMILEHKEFEDLLMEEKSKNEKFIENFDDKIFSLHQEENKEDLDEALSRGGIRSFRLFSNKQKDLIKSVNENVDDFIKDYNQHFLEHYFTKAFDEVEKIMEEKNDKKATITNTYSEQIEDMDKLLVSDSEEKYKESIQALINSLKDEQNLEIEKTDDELNLDITHLKHKFQHLNLSDEKEIQVLEEKFKYDVFNSIGNMFGFNNKK